MAMPRVMLIVGTMCNDPARRAEFNEWYNRTHIAEVCRIPGFLNGTLYEVQDPQEGNPQNVVLYDMESEETLDTFNEYVRQQSRGEAPPFTPGPPHVVLWRLICKHIGP